MAEVVSSTTRNLGSSYSVAFFVVMNKKKWDLLPKEAIEQVNAEWIEKTGQAWDAFDQAGKEFTLARATRSSS